MKHLSILFFCLFALQLQSLAQCPSSSRAGIHVVQVNDNLYQIAKQYNVSMYDLCDWNGLQLNATLHPCKELTVRNNSVSSYNNTPANTNNNVPQSYSYTPSTSYSPTVSYDSPSTSPRMPTVQEKGAPTSYNSDGTYRKQSGNRHTVRAGETVAGLANLYGYTEERFREFNVLGNEVLVPGSVVLSTDCSCHRMSYDDPGKDGYVDKGGQGNFFPPTGTVGVDDRVTDYTGKTQPPTSKPTPPPSPRTNAGNSGTKAAASYMKDVELSMIDEINLMRGNPAGYVQYIQEYVQEQRNNNGFPVNQAAVDELIRELQSSPTLSQLDPYPCVYTAAQKHGQDILRMGKSDHVGSDGSWPWDRVLRECTQLTDGNENLVGGPSTVRKSVVILLIDDGIPNRGHRKTLMRADWKYVACYKVGQVGMMPNVWVQKFAY